jgi:hypothetical protein
LRQTYLTRRKDLLLDGFLELWIIPRITNSPAIHLGFGREFFAFAEGQRIEGNAINSLEKGIPYFYGI